MITDIVEDGRERGFSSVEASREKILKEEYLREDGKIAVHHSDLQRIICRAMYERGDPLVFSLSGTGKKTVGRAFNNISGTFPASGAPNFRKLLPGKADRIKLEIYDPGFDSVGKENFRDIVDGIDETSLNFPGLKISSVSLLKQKRKFYLANSKGFDAKYRKTLYSILLRMSLKGNLIDISDNRVFFSMMEPFRLVSRGFTLLGSLTDDPPVFKKYNDLFFSPESASMLLKIFSKYFLAEDPKSAGKMNYPSILNISDDPRIDFGSGSVPFDDEGIQSGETQIIKKGVFISPVTDLRNSFLFDLKPTGNGFRKSGDHFLPGFTNLYIKPSVFSVNSMIRDSSDLFLVSLVKLIRARDHEYLFSAYGYHYNDGERGRPGRFFLSTNFHDFLLNIEKISREIRFFYSGYNTGSPYLLLKGRKTGENLIRV